MGIYTKQDCLDELYKVGQAVDDIKEAIERKGVVVPDNTPLSEYDDLIDSIPTGGDGNYDNIYDALEGINAGEGGVSLYDGTWDEDGLRAIGWSEKDIKIFKAATPHCSYDDWKYIVSEENIALYGQVNASNLSQYKDDPNLRFVPYFDTYDNPLGKQSFNDFIDIVGVPSFYYRNGERTFYNCKKLECITGIEYRDGWYYSSKVWSYMFGHCYNLRYIPDFHIPGIVSDAAGLFLNCNRLLHIPTITYEGGSISNLSALYNGINRTEISVNFDTSGTTNMSNCFGMTSPFPLGVYNVDISSATNTGQLFGGQNNYDTTHIEFKGAINYSTTFADYLVGIDYDTVKSILTAMSNTNNTNAKTFKFDRQMTDRNGELASLVSTCVSKGWTITGLTIN